MKDKTGRFCDTQGGKIRAYRILVGTAEKKKKRSSGVSMPGSKDSIKVNLQEIGWKDVDCINL